MRYGIKVAICAVLGVALTSCGKGEEEIAQIPAAPEAQSPSMQDYPVKIGEPYKIGSTAYTPQDVALYDEVGYASWYGNELDGRPTANGEVFMPAAVTAAHKTLPMPSYVEVTALDTGRTILVRINDRGPFANDRLIDLSEGAARQLGIADQGVAGVRVRRVNPPEQERATLRAGIPATARLDTPESLLKILREKLAKLPRPSGKAAAPRIASDALRAADEEKKAASSGSRIIRESRNAAPQRVPVRTAAPTDAGGSYVVQVGSFASAASAQALARKTGAQVVTSADGRLHRVRFGPFASEGEAQAALARVRKMGYPQARLFNE
jgi:rare lipoprotein A